MYAMVVSVLTRPNRGRRKGEIKLRSTAKPVEAHNGMIVQKNTRARAGVHRPPAVDEGSLVARLVELKHFEDPDS